MLNDKLIEKGDTVFIYKPRAKVNEENREIFGYFCSLVEGISYVSSGYGERDLEFVGGEKSCFHSAVDIAAERGSKVYSPIEGKVVLVSNEYCGEGLYIVREEKKDAVLLCHFDTIYVKNGQKIKQREILGTVGMTGRTTGPHIHLAYLNRDKLGRIIIDGKKYSYTLPELSLIHI